MAFVVLAAPIALALFTLLEHLLKRWRRSVARRDLHRELDNLWTGISNLEQPWQQENETVVRHEERFGRIDAALLSLTAAARKAGSEASRIPQKRGSNEALDKVLGRSSSRNLTVHAERTPLSPEPPELWIDHTKRDKLGKAVWAYYFELPAIPVVLNMTMAVKLASKKDRPCDVDIFVTLLFASFDELEDLSSRPEARKKLPTWETVLTIRCDPKEADHRAVVEAKKWALMALRREVVTSYGTDPTIEYRDAYKYRSYHEAGKRRMVQQIKLIKSELASLERVKWSLVDTSLWRWFVLPILRRVHAGRRRNR